MRPKGFRDPSVFAGMVMLTMLLGVLASCAPRAQKSPPVLGGAGREPTPVVTNTPPSLDEAGFYAACSRESSGGHAGPWTGPLRATRAEALKDAEQHNAENRGHRATVIEY